MTKTYKLPTQNNWVIGRWLSLVIPMTTMKSKCSNKDKGPFLISAQYFKNEFFILFSSNWP